MATQEGAAAGAVMPQVEEEYEVCTARGKPKHAPRYHVIIWNDEVHTYEYVIELLMTLFGHPFEKAFQITDAVHHQGRGIAYTTHKELAELKREQILAYGADPRMAVSEGPIRATIEEVPE